MAPEDFPLYRSMKSGGSGHWNGKGYDWSFLKGQGYEEAGARMSGTLPDTG